MLPGATDSADDPLEQDAPDHPADDPAIPAWFLAEGDRGGEVAGLGGIYCHICPSGPRGWT